jgi:hypothetical protein
MAQSVEEENEVLITNRQGVQQLVMWSVWGYVLCWKLGDSSSPDAADAYIILLTPNDPYRGRTA